MKHDEKLLIKKLALMSTILLPLTLIFALFSLPYFILSLLMKPNNEKEILKIIRKWRRNMNLKPKIILNFDKNVYMCSVRKKDYSNYVMTIKQGRFWSSEATIIHELFHVKKGHLEKEPENILIHVFLNLVWDIEINLIVFRLWVLGKM